MATSTAEQIYARLAALTKLQDIETDGRNIDLLDDVKLPCCVMHDGSEEAIDNPQAVGLAPNASNLMPIFELRFSGTKDTIGPKKSAFLAALQKAVLSDPTLLSLCGKVRPAGPRYLGHEFTYDSGIGNLTVNFSVSYLFDPRKL